MDEPLQTWQKTLKLPCDGLQSGQTHKTILDARVKEAATSLTIGTGGLECELNNDAAGHLVGTLKTKSCAVNLHTQFGQNVAFVSGERHTFVSYGISAECRVASLEKAAATATEISAILKIAGAIVGALTFFAIETVIAKALHFIIIPYLFVAIALVCGFWCGSKLGGLLGYGLENRALKSAEKKGVMTEADSLWNTLTQKLDLIAKEYERV
jgi:hypothetical protein